MADVLEFRAFLDENGVRKPLYVRISAPSHGEEGDFLCRIHVPLLFRKDRDIYGMDAEQAKTLAVNFIKNLLADKRIVNERGQLVRW